MARHPERNKPPSVLLFGGRQVVFRQLWTNSTGFHQWRPPSSSRVTANVVQSGNKQYRLPSVKTTLFQWRYCQRRTVREQTVPASISEDHPLPFTLLPTSYSQGTNSTGFHQWRPPSSSGVTANVVQSGNKQYRLPSVKTTLFQWRYSQRRTVREQTVPASISEDHPLPFTLLPTSYSQGTNSTVFHQWRPPSSSGVTANVVQSGNKQYRLPSVKTTLFQWRYCQRRTVREQTVPASISEDHPLPVALLPTSYSQGTNSTGFHQWRLPSSSGVTANVVQSGNKQYRLPSVKTTLFQWRYCQRRTFREQTVPASISEDHPLPVALLPTSYSQGTNSTGFHQRRPPSSSGVAANVVQSGNKQYRLPSVKTTLFQWRYCQRRTVREQTVPASISEDHPLPVALLPTSYSQGTNSTGFHQWRPPSSSGVTANVVQSGNKQYRLPSVKITLFQWRYCQRRTVREQTVPASISEDHTLPVALLPTSYSQGTNSTGFHQWRPPSSSGVAANVVQSGNKQYRLPSVKTTLFQWRYCQRRTFREQTVPASISEDHPLPVALLPTSYSQGTNSTGFHQWRPPSSSGVTANVVQSGNKQYRLPSVKTTLFQWRCCQRRTVREQTVPASISEDHPLPVALLPTSYSQGTNSTGFHQWRPPSSSGVAANVVQSGNKQYRLPSVKTTLFQSRYCQRRTVREQTVPASISEDHPLPVALLPTSYSQGTNSTGFHQWRPPSSSGVAANVVQSGNKQYRLPSVKTTLFQWRYCQRRTVREQTVPASISEDHPLPVALLPTSYSQGTNSTGFHQWRPHSSSGVAANVVQSGNKQYRLPSVKTTLFQWRYCQRRTVREQTVPASISEDHPLPVALLPTSYSQGTNSTVFHQWRPPSSSGVTANVVQSGNKQYRLPSVKTTLFQWRYCQRRTVREQTVPASISEDHPLPVALLPTSYSQGTNSTGFHQWRPPSSSGVTANVVQSGNKQYRLPSVKTTLFQWRYCQRRTVREQTVPASISEDHPLPVALLPTSYSQGTNSTGFHQWRPPSSSGVTANVVQSGNKQYRLPSVKTTLFQSRCCQRRTVREQTAPASISEDHPLPVALLPTSYSQGTNSTGFHQWRPPSSSRVTANVVQSGNKQYRLPSVKITLFQSRYSQRRTVREQTVPASISEDHPLPVALLPTSYSQGTNSTGFHQWRPPSSSRVAANVVQSGNKQYRLPSVKTTLFQSRCCQRRTVREQTVPASISEDHPLPVALLPTSYSQGTNSTGFHQWRPPSSSGVTANVVQSGNKQYRLPSVKTTLFQSRYCQRRTVREQTVPASISEDYPLPVALLPTSYSQGTNSTGFHQWRLPSSSGVTANVVQSGNKQYRLPSVKTTLFQWRYCQRRTVREQTVPASISEDHPLPVALLPTSYSQGTNSTGFHQWRPPSSSGVNANVVQSGNKQYRLPSVKTTLFQSRYCQRRTVREQTVPSSISEDHPLPVALLPTSYSQGTNSTGFHQWRPPSSSRVTANVVQSGNRQYRLPSVKTTLFQSRYCQRRTVREQTVPASISEDHPLPVALLPTSYSQGTNSTGFHQWRPPSSSGVTANVVQSGNKQYRLPSVKTTLFQSRCCQRRTVREQTVPASISEDHPLPVALLPTSYSQGTNSTGFHQWRPPSSSGVTANVVQSGNKQYRLPSVKTTLFQWRYCQRRTVREQTVPASISEDHPLPVALLPTSYSQGTNSTGFHQWRPPSSSRVAANVVQSGNKQYRLPSVKTTLFQSRCCQRRTVREQTVPASISEDHPLPVALLPTSYSQGTNSTGFHQWRPPSSSRVAANVVQSGNKQYRLPSVKTTLFQSRCCQRRTVREQTVPASISEDHPLPVALLPTSYSQGTNSTGFHQWRPPSSSRVAANVVQSGNKQYRLPSVKTTLFQSRCCQRRTVREQTVPASISEDHPLPVALLPTSYSQGTNSTGFHQWRPPSSSRVAANVVQSGNKQYRLPSVKTTLFQWRYCQRRTVREQTVPASISEDHPLPVALLPTSYSQGTNSTGFHQWRPPSSSRVAANVVQSGNKQYRLPSVKTTLFQSRCCQRRTVREQTVPASISEDHPLPVALLPTSYSQGTNSTGFHQWRPPSSSGVTANVVQSGNKQYRLPSVKTTLFQSRCCQRRTVREQTVPASISEDHPLPVALLPTSYSQGTNSTGFHQWRPPSSSRVAANVVQSGNKQYRLPSVKTTLFQSRYCQRRAVREQTVPASISEDHPHPVALLPTSYSQGTNSTGFHQWRPPSSSRVAANVVQSGNKQYRLPSVKTTLIQSRYCQRRIVREQTVPASISEDHPLPVALLPTLYS